MGGVDWKNRREKVGTFLQAIHGASPKKENKKGEWGTEDNKKLESQRQGAKSQSSTLLKISEMIHLSAKDTNRLKEQSFGHAVSFP